MTLVVGMSWPVGHDNSAAAILDGRLVFATEEERHTRHKHSVGEAPLNSLVKLFKHVRKLGVNPTDVDAFATNWTPNLFPMLYRHALFFEGVAQVAPLIKSNGERLSVARRWVSGTDYLSLSKYVIRHAYSLAGEAPPRVIKVIPVEHHLAHAASAYFFSGFGSAVSLTVDGSGEKNSTVVWRIKHGEFEKVLAMDTTDSSIGLFYESMGTRIGYDVLEGPGKLMGLAPYGGMSSVYTKVRELFRISEDGEGDFPYRVSHQRRGGRQDTWAESYLRTVGAKVDKAAWDPRGSMDKTAADIAWATQRVAEEAEIATARWAKRNLGETNLALAGGVALNAKINMEIFYSGLFDDIFIFPGANDAGGPIGAACYVHHHVLGKKMSNERLTDAYLGPEYTDEEVTKAVRDSKWSAVKVDDGMAEVAKLISAGKLVCIYQGRAELGPRALGNRSIAADPTKKEMWGTVNRIKGREWWRPLAPSLIDAKRYFVQGRPHEFMVMMYRFREEAGERVPAVRHVDGTARPQTLDNVSNPVWQNLIESFAELSGEALVVNTSFNLAGEPLVETPQDALRSFAVGGLDAIYMQGQLIAKT
jgi:carbamoyltransferase